MASTRLLLPLLLLSGPALAAAPVQDLAFFDSFSKPGAADAAAAPELITGSRIGMIVAALEKGGFDITVVKNNDGSPQINSTDANRPFALEFYGCTSGFDCGYVQFVAGWDLPNGIDAGKIASWNGDHVWGAATRDADNDPVLALSVNLRGGVSQANFADTVGLWADTLDDFTSYIGWGKQ